MTSELDSVDIGHFSHYRKVNGTGLLYRIWKDLYIILEKEILKLIESLNLYFLSYNIKKCVIL